MKRNKRNIALRSRGFSLLELMVVIVLLGLLMTIAIPSVRALNSTDLKNEITTIAGLTSEVYARAAISGKTHRINFDLDNQNYWVEEKEGDAGTVSPDLGYEELMRERVKMVTSEDEQDKLHQFLPNYKAVPGVLGEKHTLDSSLVIYGAWTEPMEEVSRSGLISIYFFSGGYTQVAFVSLAKKEQEADTAMYVALSPLTGNVEINLGEPEINDLLDNEKVDQ